MNILRLGDCLEVMKGLHDGFVDTIITDPPYGLSFMGKKWDYDVPSVEIWQECLRVLKPGGTLLCFAGSRTQHRMACNVEDAGFILKDCIMWLYGSGFPKATDISKQIDKRGGHPSLTQEIAEALKQARTKRGVTKSQADKMFCGGTTLYSWYEGRPAGIELPTSKYMRKIADAWPELEKYIGLTMEAEREIVGKQLRSEGRAFAEGSSGFAKGEIDITEPATPEAILWDGWKSHGLKPAYEPILVAMKLNEGTYANNALVYGVSGLNIDGGRIPLDGDYKCKANGRPSQTGLSDNYKPEEANKPDTVGRYPANIILDEEAGAMLDEQSGVSGSGKRTVGGTPRKTEGFVCTGSPDRTNAVMNIGDSGGASRFFYCAKASKKERNAGCEGLESIKTNDGRQVDADNAYQRGKSLRTNHHPTVKPLALMEYLCTLTKTPTGGIVLDPFMGSGTTGVACKKLNRTFVGIEKDPAYFEIAKQRINNA